MSSAYYGSIAGEEADRGATGHKCSFPGQPPHGSVFAPGDCVCGRTHAQSLADKALTQALALVRAAYPQASGWPEVEVTDAYLTAAPAMEAISRAFTVPGDARGDASLADDSREAPRGGQRGAQDPLCPCDVPLLARRDAHAASAAWLGSRPLLGTQHDPMSKQEQAARVTDIAVEAAAPHIRADERLRVATQADTSRPSFDRPVVVCLCGSTRFVDRFNKHRKQLTISGEIVLSIEVVTTQAREEDPQHSDPELKARLDELHKRKIDMADYCLVVSDETGYFGPSTTGEIAYAVAHGKPVRFAEEAAHRRAFNAGLLPVVPCGCTVVPGMPLCEHQKHAGAYRP